MTARKKIRGFSLIEAAIVLGVVGLVIGGIWTAASAINARVYEWKFMEGALGIVTNAQNLVTSGESCGGYWKYIHPELLDIIWPQQWRDIGHLPDGSVSSKISAPNFLVSCDFGKHISLIFYSDRYFCSSLGVKLASACNSMAGCVIPLYDYICAQPDGNEIQFYFPITH